MSRSLETSFNRYELTQNRKSRKNRRYSSVHLVVRNIQIDKPLERTKLIGNGPRESIGAQTQRW
jgi:hypothetical protein